MLELLQKELVVFIKEVVTAAIAQERSRVVESLRAIEKWPEPNSTAGEGGFGPLYTTGLLDQYSHDKQKHEQQIDDIIAIITNTK